MSLEKTTILCPTDFSETSQNALNYAKEMAEKFSAKVVLLHVVEPIHLYPATLHQPELVKELRENLEKEANKLLEDCRSTITEIDVEAELIVGKPHEEIVRAGEKWNAGLIVIGTVGRSGISHFFLGSTAEKVVRKAGRPVMVVGPQQDK